MEEKKKKKPGQIILFVLIFLAAAAMAAFPLFFGDRQTENRSKASILSTKVERGTIRKTLSGTGTLAEQEAQTVAVPSGVYLTEYLVKNGQYVQEGDPLAAVDRASVMEAISSVQAAMETKASELETARISLASVEVNAAASGRVKAMMCRRCFCSTEHWLYSRWTGLWR